MKSDYKRIKAKLQQEFNTRINNETSRFFKENSALRSRNLLLIEENSQLKEENQKLKDEINIREEHINRLIEFLNLSDEEKKIFLQKAERPYQLNSKQIEAFNVYTALLDAFK